MQSLLFKKSTVLHPSGSFKYSFRISIQIRRLITQKLNFLPQIMHVLGRRLYIHTSILTKTVMIIIVTSDYYRSVLNSMTKTLEIKQGVIKGRVAKLNI